MLNGYSKNTLKNNYYRTLAVTKFWKLFLYRNNWHCDCKIIIKKELKKKNYNYLYK